MLEFTLLLAKCQEAVDECLSDQQQMDERQVDGTFRVRCMRCSKSVSNPLPMPVIVRASVTCPECLEALAAHGGLS